MGPRGAARRSEVEVISGQHDKSPGGAASRWRELWRRRGTWAYLALLALVSAVCALLPMADHLGYELAEVVALCAGLCALAVPVALILVNGLRRPACDPAAGLMLYLAIAVPSGVLAAALGVA